MKDKQIKTLRNKVKNGGSVAPMLIVLGVLVCSVAYFGGWFESGQAFYNPDIDFDGKTLQWLDYGNTELKNVSCDGYPLPLDWDGDQKTVEITYPNKGLYYVLPHESGKTYEIDFGDGSPHAGHTVPSYADGIIPDGTQNPMFYHTYANTGTYTAKLSVNGVVIDTETVNITSTTPTESIYKDNCHAPTVQMTWYDQMWYEFKDWWTHLFNPKTYDGTSTIVSSQDVIAVSSPFNYTAENSSTAPCTITFDASDAMNYFGTHDSDGTVKDDWTYHQNDYPLDKYNFNYSWNFGDGSTGTGTKVTHAYTCDCQKTVTLSAVVTSINCVDKDGNAIVCPPDAFYVTSSKEINTCAHPVVIPVDPIPPDPTPTLNTYTTYWYDNTTKSTGCQVATRFEGKDYAYEGLCEFDTMAECEKARTSNYSEPAVIDFLSDLLMNVGDLFRNILSFIFGV